MFRFLYILSLFSFSVFAAKPIDLAQNTQWVLQPTNSRVQFVWLIPTKYWEISFAEGNVSDAEKNKMLNVIDKYTLFAVADLTIGMAGIPTGLDELAIKEKLILRDTKGKPVAPLALKEQEQDLRSLLDVMKPIFKNMVGAMGEQMQFIVYPGFDVEGTRVFDFNSNGIVRFEYDKQTFSVRTPLAGLLEKKTDKETGEKFPGNYLFNPYSGRALD